MSPFQAMGWGALALVGALAAYGAGYTLWANAKWPAEGRFVKAERARVHVLEAGEGPLVLALHGASANARELWQPLMPLLSTDFRFLAMDRPGHGHSSRPAGARTFEVQARLAAAVIEDAGAGPAIIVAHSMGSGTALRLALDRPDLVAGLVLLAPASHPYPGDNAWYARLASTPVVGPAFAWGIVPVAGPFMSQGGVTGVFAPAPAPDGYAEQSGLMLLFRPGNFRANALDVTATKAEFAAQAPRYPEILAPAIVITADLDRVVSPRIHARALASELPAAELVTLPGVGHMPHRLRPDVAAAAVRRIATMAQAETTP